MIDLHCHILPAIDDGAADAVEALGMARLAVADGIETIVATPHQLGAYLHNEGETILARAEQFQGMLDAEQIPLRIVPGAELRLEVGLDEAELAARLERGTALTLANQRRHVLVDFREHIFFALDRLLAMLREAGIAAILAHPERNLAILAQPDLLLPLVEAGCLVQVTAGSLLGEFGAAVQALAERLIDQQMAQIVASDAHHFTFRKPLLADAFRRVTELADEATARRLCHDHPAAVIAGEPLAALTHRRDAR